MEMAGIIIFIAMILYVVIRTVAYGIYCVKKTGLTGGISVFFLAAGAVIAGYITIFGNKGIG